ncbi:YihY/virulence factor BrkB family protein [Rhizorhapis sp. SPR117]|uniref:YihY/virulence factor BrkB family protein n=1 Tax=Rhizorhapis sp. SPR117 TaxID=2912611 RepID=UPI001F215F64|nr:YihY/virulence factor BrkB family protein [Rhizorhapis sp. SPR117]
MADDELNNTPELPRKLSGPELVALRREIPGAKSGAQWHLPASAWWSVMKRIYVMNDFYNLPMLAAGVAFFAFLAVVPFIASIVLIYGLIGDPQTVAKSLNIARDFVPEEVMHILAEQLMEIVTTSATAKGFGLGIALGLSLYGAMRAATAMIKALNIIYEEYETRNIIRTTGVALGITVGMVSVAIIGLIAISWFGYVSIFLSRFLGPSALLFVQIATWLVAGMLVSCAFALIYRLAPDRRAAKWRWLTAGSVVSTLMWVAISLGFGFYAANITDYNATYGSLAAIVIFLMWLFLSAYSVLIGAEINAETERQTMRDSTVGPDRPIGQRGAVMADNIALDEAKRAVLEKKKRKHADHVARRVT